MLQIYLQAIYLKYTLKRPDLHYKFVDKIYIYVAGTPTAPFSIELPLSSSLYYLKIIFILLRKFYRIDGINISHKVNISTEVINKLNQISKQIFKKEMIAKIYILSFPSYK